MQRRFRSVFVPQRTPEHTLIESVQSLISVFSIVVNMAGLQLAGGLAGRLALVTGTVAFYCKILIFFLLKLIKVECHFLSNALVYSQIANIIRCIHNSPAIYCCDVIHVFVLFFYVV